MFVSSAGSINSSGLCCCSGLFLTKILVHLGLDVVDEAQHILDDLLLVVAQLLVHFVQAVLRVLLDAVQNALPGADVLYVEQKHMIFIRHFDEIVFGECTVASVSLNWPSRSWRYFSISSVASSLACFRRRVLPA